MNGVQPIRGRQDRWQTAGRANGVTLVEWPGPTRGAFASHDRQAWRGELARVAFPRSYTMKAMKNLLGKLVRDEQGGEVLEYALIAGLIVVAAIAVIGAVGTKVLGRWTSLNSSL
jgi:Flp pilus assembly pilin Flp